MADPKPQTPPNAPYGTYPRRSVWPLVLLIVAFALWFAVLLWMAAVYPAR